MCNNVVENKRPSQFTDGRTQTVSETVRKSAQDPSGVSYPTQNDANRRPHKDAARKDVLTQNI